GPNAGPQYVIGGEGGFLSHAVHEVHGNVTGRKDAGAAGDKAFQVRDAGVINFKESLENSRKKDGAAVVRLRCARVIGGFCGLSECAAKRFRAVGRLAELLRQLSEQVVFPKISLGDGDGLLERSRDSEMLEKSDDVGEGFVEGGDIRIGLIL